MLTKMKTIEEKPTLSIHHKKMNPQIGEVGNVYETSAGKSYPLGATVYSNGVNFSVFSKNSETVELYLFHAADDNAPFQVIPLDLKTNKSFPKTKNPRGMAVGESLE